MKLLIITGTSQGLGKAFFDYFKNGYSIFSISRRFMPDQCELQSKDPERFILQKDDLSNIREETFNKLTLLLTDNSIEHVIFINNAGVIKPIGNIGILPQTELIQSIAVNFTAPVLISNCIFSAIGNLQRTTVINISSGAASHPIQGWPLYCSVKAGTKMFFEVLKIQNVDNPKIFIENVDPGIIDTTMQQTLRNASGEEFPSVEKFQKYKENNELQTPEEAALKIITQYILKDENSSIS